MKRTGRKKEWTIALFCGGLLFLFPPLLTIFDKADFIFGLPVSYVVLYGFWAFVIAAVAYGARRKPQDDASDKPPVPLKNHQDDY